MGIFQSKCCIQPNHADYEALLELAKPELQQLVKSIEDTMSEFRVRPTSMWYFTVQGKQIAVHAPIFLKLFKQYSVRDYLLTTEGCDTVIQFIYEGKSV